MPTTAHVTNFTEFLSAIGDSSNDIVELPEGETWDVSRYKETGTTNYIPVLCGEIRGNGTTIQGLTWTKYWRIGADDSIARPVFLDLNFENFRSAPTSGADLPYLWIRSRGAVFEGCKFSVNLWKNAWNYYYGGFYCQWGGVYSDESTFTRCSFNVESPAPHFSLMSGNCNFKECVLYVTAENATAGYGGDDTGEYLGDEHEHCEIIVNMPRITKLKMYGKRCTLRGDLTGLSTMTCHGMGYGFWPYEMICVYDATSAPNATPTCSAGLTPNFVGVTLEQMCNAQYLESIGFPIGGI